MIWLYHLAAPALLVLSWFYSSIITYFLLGMISLLVVFFLTWFELPFLDNLDDLDEAQNERTD